MGFYRAYVLPQLLGFSERVASMELVRQRTVEYATGHVLEIGIGLGSTLPFYHEDITSLTTVDPNSRFNAQIRRRLRHLPFPIDVREGHGEALPLKDRTFDCVVTSFALCCTGDLEEVVREISRVLKPGGRLLFAEPGPSREESVLKWQRRVARLQRWIGDGCRADREIDVALLAAGFEIKRLEMTYLEGLPKALACIYEGLATKPT